MGTFFAKNLEGWVQDALNAHGKPRRYVRKVQELLTLLLQQAQDSITPDLAIRIQGILANEYGTFCPDIVAIIGGKILPRIRATVGMDTYNGLSRKAKAKWCVLEYMQNRRGYDTAVGETEETTFMRDTLNIVVSTLVEKEMIVRELGPDSSDAILSASDEHNDAPQSSTRRFVMLRNPNSAAADLFSLDIVEDAAKAMSDSRVEAPSPEDWRRRVFKLFRCLHFRATKKLGTSAYAAYGLDDGLRKTDKVFLKLQHQLPELHNEMLQNSWKVRDYLGWQSKKLHSNRNLPLVLFSEHLELPEAE